MANMPQGITKTESATKGTRYVVRYYDPNGRQRQATFSRLTDAQGFKRRQEGDKERGDWFDPNAGRRIYAEVYKEWLAGKHFPKERTRQGYESLYVNQVAPTFAEKRVGRITKADVKAWVADRQNAGVGAGTIRNAFRNVLKPSLDHAVENGYLKANPALGVKLPLSPLDQDEQQFLTPAEVQALADELPPNYATLVTFAAYTGLRSGEIAALRIRNLDLMRRTVDVRESASEVIGKGLVYGPTKTKTSRRTVPLPSFLVEPLTLMVAPYAADPDALVFRAPDGGPLRHGNFYSRYFRPAVSRSLPEKPSLRFHDLRHTCAALMVNLAGADPYNIMRRLGHSSIQVTFDRYAHLFPERDETITRGLEQAYLQGFATPTEPAASITAMR